MESSEEKELEEGKNDVGRHAEAVSVSRCCGHVLTNRPSTCPHLQTPHHSVTCLFSGSSEGKRLWDILQSRPTKELLTKIPLTFCHRDCILPCFCILLLMQISPLFLYPSSHSARNLGRTGVCAYTNHQIQRFQTMPLGN